MDWSEQALQRIYEASMPQYGRQRHTVGDLWPYNGGSDQDIVEYFHDIVNDLGNSEAVIAKADFTSFDSGYGSFIDIFCCKKDGSSTQPFLGSGERTVGIEVYVSCLAPVAAYGRGQRTWHAHGGSSTFLERDTIGTTPPGDWSGVVKEVSTKLKARGLEIADAGTLNRSLPFEADIETILEEPPYRIFDLLFHWSD